MIVSYHEAAEDEFLTELGYLETQCRGLGRRFYSEARRAEQFIAKFPKVAAQIRPGIRKWPLRTFEYCVIYSIEESQILILAVAHNRRRPGYWVGRVST